MNISKEMREFLLGLASYVTIALVFLFLCSDAFAGNVTLNWTFDISPTATCADGSLASANCPLSSFDVQEQVNGIWTSKSPLSLSLRSYTYTNVAAGRRCFRMRANANGTMSEPSNESCLDVPVSAPKAPIITVTIAIGSPPP